MRNYQESIAIAEKSPKLIHSFLRPNPSPFLDCKEQKRTIWDF